METRAQSKAKEVEMEESRLAELESRLTRRFSAEIERIRASSSHRSSGTIKPIRLRPLKYSWEEVNERREKGLCIFCEANETPDHHLKHKGLGLVFMDVDDQFFDEEALVEPVVEQSSALLMPKGEDSLELEESHTKTEPNLVVLHQSDSLLATKPDVAVESEQDMVENESILATQPDVEFIQKDPMKQYRVVHAHLPATLSLSINQTEEISETDDNSSPLWHRWKTKSRVAEPPNVEGVKDTEVQETRSDVFHQIKAYKTKELQAISVFKSAAYEVQVQSMELVVRDQNQEAISVVVPSPMVSVKRVGAIQSQPCISGGANHVWKPGELKRVLSHATRSVWEPGEIHCVQVQENRVQHERNKAEGIEFFVQRIGVASEMENQTVTAVVVYEKRSDRVWEPGGIPTKLNMWDWTENNPRQGDVFEFEADLLEGIIQQDENPERHSFLQSETFQPFHQNQVFDELEMVESKSSTNPMLGSMLTRNHKWQQVRKLRLSPKPWLFKFKQKLIRLKIRDKEFQIAMLLAPKILKVHHMFNSLVIAEAAAPIYPTIEYLSQFFSKVGIDKEHSSSSLRRANQVWDPGGKILYLRSYL